MMNFSVTVDDHLLGLTHVLRGKDHLANSEKQKYLYQHMGWEIPEFIHYGRLKMEDIALKECNDQEFIPKEYRERHKELMTVNSVNSNFDKIDRGNNRRQDREEYGCEY